MTESAMFCISLYEHSVCRPMQNTADSLKDTVDQP